MPVERKALSILQACDLVQVSRRTIYNWLRDGKLEFFRTPGGSVRIYKDSLFYNPLKSNTQAINKETGVDDE